MMGLLDLDFKEVHMGYFTDYSLMWDSDKPEDGKNISEFISNLPYWNGEEFDYSTGEIYFGEAKWYDYQKDLCALSKEFPNILFHMYGNGDDYDDLWEEHWQNGKYQHCHAEIPPFNRSKMTTYVEQNSLS